MRCSLELGFNYNGNQNAGMISNLFYEWLRRFDNYTGQAEKKECYFAWDNCSAHGTVETIPHLQNVILFFLPPKTTSKIPPMNGRFVAVLETQYWSFQMDRALNLTNVETCDEYKVSYKRQCVRSSFCGVFSIHSSKDFWKHTGAINDSTFLSV